MSDHLGKISSLLAPDVTLYSVEPHIFSVYPESEPVHHYDQNVQFYDRVIGNRFYNRLMWGYSISTFSAFTQSALRARESGWVFEAGCGSLIFTAEVYAGYRDRPVLMLDQSIQMLRAAKSRLAGLCGEVPANIVFLQGDILQLPFRKEVFSTLISLSVLHIIENMDTMLDQLWNCLGKGGNFSLTSLILGRSIGDRYLRYLYKSGGVATPRDTDQILKIFARMDIPVDHIIYGNMLFINTDKQYR